MTIWCRARLVKGKRRKRRQGIFLLLSIRLPSPCQKAPQLAPFMFTKNPRYKEGTLFSLWKALLKMCFGFSIYTRRSIFETLVLFGLELLLGLIKILQIQLSIDRACLSINQTRQILKSSFCILLVLESWLESP